MGTSWVKAGFPQSSFRAFPHLLEPLFHWPFLELAEDLGWGETVLKASWEVLAWASGSSLIHPSVSQAVDYYVNGEQKNNAILNNCIKNTKFSYIFCLIKCNIPRAHLQNPLCKHSSPNRINAWWKLCHCYLSFEGKSFLTVGYKSTLL